MPSPEGGKRPKLLDVGTEARTLWLILGHPHHLPTDTQVVIRKADTGARGGRYRVERKDGVAGSWWVDGEALKIA